MKEKSPLHQCVSCGTPLLSQADRNALFNQQHRSKEDTLDGINCRLVGLRPGMVAALYGGNGRTQTQARMLNNSRYVHFSCLMQDMAEAEVRKHQCQPDVGSGHIIFAPGEFFSARYGKDYISLDLMVEPEALADVAADDYGRIEADIRQGFLVRTSTQNRQIMHAAHILASRLDHPKCQQLLLQSAALEFLGAHFSSLKDDKFPVTLPMREQQRIMTARDRLLHDLSAPPTIEQLSREVGLNQLKLKQGFKILFGTSIYAMFQKHRMEHARFLLKNSNVTEVAITMGYSNISHFSAAYRKQFGILPKYDRG